MDAYKEVTEQHGEQFKGLIVSEVSIHVSGVLFKDCIILPPCDL